MVEAGKLRLDKYLWAIRIFKTRSIATDACNNGKVKFNGLNAKPSRTVAIGDKYEIKTEAKKWIIQVTGLLHTRLQYSEAIKYYIDLSPVEEKSTMHGTAFVFQTGKRQSKQGRPTKKQNRDRHEFSDAWLLCRRIRSFVI